MENNNTTTPELLIEKPEKYKIVKIILYFWLAASGILWAILGALWIKFKAKQNKRPKFIAVGFGFLVGVVATFGVTLYTHIKNPELRTIEDALSQQFPNGTAVAGINWEKHWKSGSDAVTTNTLVVDFKSKKAISGDTMISMGRSTCEALGAENTKYDVVAIVNLISPIYPITIPFFKYDFSVSNTCNNWLNNLDFEQSIKSFR